MNHERESRSEVKCFNVGGSEEINTLEMNYVRI